MRVSAKTEYACIAMLELTAAYGTGEPVCIRTIAEQHEIPPRFLVQILLQLKGAGFVTSTRGSSGGYQLAKAPSEISLGEIMTSIDGPDEGLTSSASPDSLAGQVLQSVWRDVAEVEREMLGGTSFAELAERAKKHADVMYYI